MGLAVAVDLDLSKINLHQLARDSGYSFSHINRVMNKRRTPTMKCAAQIVEALGITLDQFHEWLNR